MCKGCGTNNALKAIEKATAWWIYFAQALPQCTNLAKQALMQCAPGGGTCAHESAEDKDGTKDRTFLHQIDLSGKKGFGRARI